MALKQMSKSRYHAKNVRARAFAERELLAEARNRWFVDLLATFQDADNVFMAMEFLQGGDLCFYMEQRGRLTEPETRFYMAELLEALDVVHRCGFVHRDVKSDNIMLTVEGHLKLLDFGLCKPEQTQEQEQHEQQHEQHDQPPQLQQHLQQLQQPSNTDTAAPRRQRLKSMAGTPQYMPPEAFQGQSSAAGDLWALGILTFECLYGNVPFHAGAETGQQAIVKVAKQVQHHADLFPMKLERAIRRGYVGQEASQLLLKLICDSAVRLKAEDIRREAFFGGIDFSCLHLQPAPIVPLVQNPEDASNFIEFKTKELPPPPRGAERDAALEWTHYEFDRETHELQQPDGVTQLFQSSPP